MHQKINYNCIKRFFFNEMKLLKNVCEPVFLFLFIFKY